MKEWRNIAKKGHELGNHSICHPCRKSLPAGDWVPPHHDLDNYTVEQMVEELTTTNTFLHALDGKLNVLLHLRVAIYWWETKMNI